MKFGKKLLSLFLSVVMLVSMLGTTALAAGGSANVEFTVDKSTAAVGDTITVVFKNKEMTVSSFTGGIFFDKNKLECTSIVGPDSEYPSDFGLTKKTGKNPWVDATAVSNVTQANNAGTVGFGYAGASDVEYAASELYTATFKVKEGATGTAVFTLYEDTAGTDTFKSDSIESKSVTIGGGTPTPPAPTTYTVSFNAGGGTGTMANGTTDAAGKYTLPACGFTAPSGKEFKAWQVNSEEKAVGAEITLTADTTVTALWKDIPHTCVFNQETVKDDALKSAATCQSKAVYYKSCTCGAVSTNAADTFESGEKNPNNHTGTLKETWEKDASKHWHVYTCCPTVKGAEASHTFVNSTAATGALKSAATCMSKAVYYKSCSVCGQLSTDTFESGEKDAANHASGCTLGGWQKNDSKHWKEYSLCHTKVEEGNHSFAEGDTTCSAGCGQTRKLTQTITANNVTATYHDTPGKIVVSGAMTDVTFEVIEGKDVVDKIEADGTPHYLKAGTAKVKITAAGNETYNAAETTVTVTINQKSITIASATAKPRDYQSGNKDVEIAGVSFNGASIGGSDQLEAKGVMDDDTAGTDKVVHVTVTLKGVAANNYKLADSTCDTTVTINKIDPTAPSGLTGKTGNKLSTVTLPTGWTWVNGDTVMTEAGEKQFAAKYVDTTGNYNDVASKDLTVNVSDKIPQTLNVSDTITATYGDTNVSVAPTGAHGAVTYTETSDVVNVDASGNVTILKAGTATVTVAAAGDANYASASKTVTINVSKKSLTVTAKNQSIYVNGTAPDLTAADAYTVSGLVGEDTVSVSLAYSETPDVTKTGSYDIVVTATADADKYELTKVDGKLTISNRSGSGSSKTYAIAVESAENGAVKADRKNAGAGTKINVTVAPDKGYTLETLTVLDKSGKEVKLTAKDGKYSFLMPASNVTVKATFAEDNSLLNFFVDVPAGEYYADPVLWAAENGITGGVDAVHFAPDMTCTRAQAVTFLWRAAGCPAPKSAEMPFADVVSGSYYYDAVLWAVENGITKGTSETSFSPDMECSRAQIVTFLWRSQKSPAASAANPFADVSADAYYASAVLWAVKNGVTTGTAADTFSPDANCTRAQIVTFIYRSMK